MQTGVPCLMLPNHASVPKYSYTRTLGEVHACWFQYTTQGYRLLQCTVSTVTNVLWKVQENAMQKQGRVPSGFSVLLIVWTDCGYKGGSHEVALRITIKWEEAEVVKHACIVNIWYI